MNYLKKFEEFDFSKSLPITTKNILTNYYSCDECDNIWREFNEESEKCKYCGSKEIEELSENEWYEIAKSRLPEKELKDIENERDKEKSTFVDIVNLQNKSRRYYAN